jgi:DedD protein
MKHRLVGTAVLVALGILAWPVIFDTTPVREINRRSQIPEAPEIDRFSVPEPAAVQLPPAPDSEALRAAADQGPPSPVEESAGAVEPAATPVAKAEVPSATGDEYGLPEQWALQLGVFSQQDNAMEVRDRAEKAGYHAILQPVKADNGTRYRVYVAPKLDKRALERLAPEVEKKLGIKGYVTRYYP